MRTDVRSSAPSGAERALLDSVPMRVGDRPQVGMVGLNRVMVSEAS